MFLLQWRTLLSSCSKIYTLMVLTFMFGSIGKGVDFTDAETTNGIHKSHIHHLKQNGKLSHHSASSESYHKGFSYSTDNPPHSEASINTDPMGFESIKFLHAQLDDDANGRVDVQESKEFLREELNYDHSQDRSNLLHAHDQHIEVMELWQAWVVSDVHNWTKDEVIEWLINHVELAQYADVFDHVNVKGVDLPKLATNQQHYVSNILGIKDVKHRQKISLKAMDVVLFGAPKHSHGLLKDIALLTSMLVALAGCWYALAQKKSSQQHMSRMFRDLESLNKAEQALADLQKKLEEAHREQKIAVEEKKKVEEKLMDEIQEAKQEAKKIQATKLSAEEEMNRLKVAEDELMQLRSVIEELEEELEHKKWKSPPLLQEWLQVTYEVEKRHYNHRRLAAEQQLENAKDACEKLKRRRGTFMGSFRVAHGNAIDDVDARIIAARQALDSVTKDLKERLHRWHHIELLCGFNIQHNPGLDILNNVLLSSPPSHYDVDPLHRIKTTPCLREVGKQGSQNSQVSRGSLHSSSSSHSLGASALQSHLGVSGANPRLAHTLFYLQQGGGYQPHYHDSARNSDEDDEIEEEDECEDVEMENDVSDAGSEENNTHNSGLHSGATPAPLSGGDTILNHTKPTSPLKPAIKTSNKRRGKYPLIRCDTDVQPSVLSNATLIANINHTVSVNTTDSPPPPYSSTVTPSAGQGRKRDISHFKLLKRSSCPADGSMMNSNNSNGKTRSGMGAAGGFLGSLRQHAKSSRKNISTSSISSGKKFY